VQVFPPKPGRNAADIALVIDAMEQVDHADAFAIAAGDGDYARLALRLRERNKFVIVMGREGDMSENLRACCDQFIYVGAKTQREPVPDEAQNRPVTKQGEEKPALKKEEKSRSRLKANPHPPHQARIRRILGSKMPCATCKASSNPWPRRESNRHSGSWKRSISPGSLDSR
jgi:hypothetical protein